MYQIRVIKREGGKGGKRGKGGKFDVVTDNIGVPFGYSATTVRVLTYLGS